MIAMNEVETVKPARARSPRKPSDRPTGGTVTSTPKSKDARKVKVSFYVDAETAGKLAVAAIIRRADQSDVVNEILGKALSSVTYYDRSTRPAEQSLTTGEIGTEAAA